MVDDGIKEQIREATDIAAVIGQYVNLKRRGTNLLGLCPFHTEKTPSFSVHPDRQFYHCFGCGKGGDVFAFLMEHEGWGFPEALKYCADRAGIQLPERHPESDRESQRREQVYAALALADRMYRKLLFTADGEHALTYLHKRGFKDETLRAAGVGYAPGSYDRLLKAARARMIPVEALESSGLSSASRKTGEPFDRFRNRITFPIVNLSGKTVGFGARALAEGDDPKYLNSPETALYQKSRILYGLSVSRDAIRKSESAIIVEGYLDWLRLIEMGFGNVVAVSGTALTSEQATTLARFCKRVTLLFDADSAGERATLRGVDVAFNAGLAVDIAVLPSGDDPDSFLVREGAEALRTLIDRAPSIVEYRVKVARREAGDHFDFLARERLVKELVELARLIDDPDRREVFLSEAANYLGVDQDYLRQAIHKGTDSARERSSVVKGTPAKKTILTGDSEFLRVLLEKPDYVGRAQGEVDPEDFEHPLHQKMYGVLVKYVAAGGRKPTPAELAQTPDEEALWRRLLTYEIDTSACDRVFDDGLSRFADRRRHRRVGHLKEEIVAAERVGDKERVAALLREYEESRGAHSGSGPV